MTNNIIQVTQDAKKIVLFDYIVHCPICGQRQHSPFDKLFTKAYERCVDCSGDKDITAEGDNIFAIIEAVL